MTIEQVKQRIVNLLMKILIHDIVHRILLDVHLQPPAGEESIHATLVIKVKQIYDNVTTL